MELEDFTGGKHFDQNEAELANSQTAAGREQQAAKETELPAQFVTNRFKCRQYLEGMNAEEKIRSKRDALLELLDKQQEPRESIFRLFGITWFRVRNGAQFEAHYDACQRILWALIGELSLELSAVNCSKQAAEIRAEEAANWIPMRNNYAAFRNFFLERYADEIAVAEMRNMDLFSLAKQIMLDQAKALKGGSS